MNNLVFSVSKAKFDRKNCVRTVAKHSIFLERGFFLCARSLIKVIPYYFDNEGVHMRKTWDSCSGYSFVAVEVKVYKYNITLTVRSLGKTVSFVFRRVLFPAGSDIKCILHFFNTVYELQQ